MKRTHLTDSPEQADIDVTPMLDVVFILLIFFIVTATFVRETGLDSNRAQDNQTPPQSKQVEAIQIRIAPDNSVWVNQRMTDIRRVSAAILRLQVENPDRKVVIEPSADSTAEMLVAVIDASREARVYDYSVADSF